MLSFCNWKYCTYFKILQHTHTYTHTHPPYLVLCRLSAAAVNVNVLAVAETLKHDCLTRSWPFLRDAYGWIWPIEASEANA